MPVIDSCTHVRAKGLALGSALILLGVVVWVYRSSLTTGFFADDYNFLEPAARLDLPQYLIKYFDPRAQTMWYRPLQGLQFLIEYRLFGANASGYHWVSVLIHAVDTWLLFALVWRISAQWRLGLLTALLYSTFPVYALAVNWINITDPVTTIFYLAGIWFWWSYLRGGNRRDYILTLAAFTLGLLNKQMAATLPAVLFLMEYLLAGNSFKLGRVVRQYIPFAVILAFFAGVQYFTRSTHVFAGTFGYSIGPHVVSILIQYLSLAVFPWGYFPPSDTQITEGMPFADTGNLVWLAAAGMIYLYFVIRYRSRALLFLGGALLIALLPVLPFPFVELRYLYLPAMVSALLLALWIDHAWSALGRAKWAVACAGLAILLLILGAQQSVANANAGIYEIARQRRVPFRDISQMHPTFPQDTHLYFIEPISPLSELTGMFTLRYGPGVTVGANTAERPTRLRDHKNAFVYYFDETGKPHEVAVEPEPVGRLSTSLPARFEVPIELEEAEIARTALKRGELIIALLRWRARGKIEKDYTVFLHLLDKNGQIVAGYDNQPDKGAEPTSQWRSLQFVVDPILLAVPRDLPAGTDYQLEIGLYDLQTMQRISILDERGQPSVDRIMFGPIAVIDQP